MQDELDYQGTQSFSGNPINVVKEDEKDEPVLRVILKMLDDAITFSTDQDTLDISKDSPFTVEQQIAMNRRVKQTHLEMKAAIDEVLTNIGEKYGR